MAIRFLFEEVLNKRIWIDIHYSKVPETLPVVLTKDEVRALLGSIGNPKHRLMIELLYSAGLRVSELLNLRICDLDTIEEGEAVLPGAQGFLYLYSSPKIEIFINM
jgi:integrase/recombinase XerD